QLTCVVDEGRMAQFQRVHPLVEVQIDEVVDEVVVQLYRDSPAALARELAQPSLRMAGQRVPVRIGLLAGLKGQVRPLKRLQQDIAQVRARGLPAVDLFFYESAREQRQRP
ncbi:MAG: hypothetical protein RLZZ11_1740, partial [Cyanobacteriota bacterium]